MPTQPANDSATQLERRRQVRGLTYLAIGALGFALLRAMMHGGAHGIFPHGWWRIR
jgi:hypothetical protein